MDIGYIVRVSMQILSSAGTTLTLFALVILVSLPLGFGFTLLAGSRIKPLRLLMNGFIYCMRGTPLMLQLMFVYFGMPYIPLVGQFLRFSRFEAAVVAFILNYAAYFAEIYRGGLLAVNKGQYEAAQVLGLTKVQTMVRVVIPQMLRVSLPSIANESVTLVKDTSLVFTIGIVEIIHITKTIVNRDYNPLVFAIAAVIYLLINMVLTWVFKKLEQKMAY